MLPVSLLYPTLDTAWQFSCLATLSQRALAFFFVFMASFTYLPHQEFLFVSHTHAHILVGKKMCSLLFPFLNLIVVTL